MKIIFNGDTPQIDANTLISALGHYQFIMEMANKEMGGSKTVELKINAIEKGSFVIDVEIVESALKSLFSGSSLGYISSVITIVGGVYAAYKKLKGKPARNEEEIGKTIIKGEDNVIINRSIFNIYNGIQAREAISKTIEAADKDQSVQGFTIEGEGDTTHFDRDSFHEYIHRSFESDELLPPDNIIEEPAMLTILTMSFESGYQWNFIYKGFKIPVKIKEGPLMDIIDKGARFGKGDQIEVVLEIVQKYNPSYNAYENVKFKIKEFIRHIPVASPPSIFD